VIFNRLRYFVTSGEDQTLRQRFLSCHPSEAEIQSGILPEGYHPSNSSSTPTVNFLVLKIYRNLTKPYLHPKLKFVVE